MKTTQRDMRLLARINAFGFMTVEQIAAFWGVDFSTAARRVRKLVEAGLLRRHDLSVMSSKPLVVTRVACALAGDPIPPITGIRPGTFRHDTMIPDMALALERRFGGKYETERQLRAQPGLAAGHLPDGIVHLPDGRQIGIELELTQKSQRRLSEILAIHASNLSLDEVWYLIVDESMRPALARVAADHPHVKIVKWTPAKRRAVAPTTSKPEEHHDIAQS